MATWAGWLIVAGLLAVVEFATLAVVAGLLSVAAALAAIVAALGAQAAEQPGRDLPPADPLT